MDQLGGKKVRNKAEIRPFLSVVAGLLLATSGANAQSVAYRQTNLASDVSVPGLTNHTDAALQNSWGIAFVPGDSFFITDANNGRVIVRNATGSATQPSGFNVSAPANSDHGTPTGIVADSNSLFGGGDFVKPFITVTQDGAIFIWGADTNGDIPVTATLAVDNSQTGAVYTGVAILTPDCCAPLLAVANFHSGKVEVYNTNFSPLGSFLDPSSPAGYAPYGMQVIANQLYVTSALQDGNKHDPVFGAGNGIVSVFDMEGHFLRRFATAGPLNAPWGITQASANFGPFSNNILIGNVADGSINAFDLATGNFVGQVKDGDDNLIVNSGLHGLTFRPDGFGDPNTLFFAAGINNGQDGLFGAITTGLVSVTHVTAPSTHTNTTETFSANVAAGPGNAGQPTGSVTFADNSIPVGTVPLNNGNATFDATLASVGIHNITARFNGDATFLPSTGLTDVHVFAPATSLTLAAPANAAPGSAVALTATISSSAGTPTGQIAFLDGNTTLGTAPLNASGVAALTINTLAAGIHNLTASFAGDQNFESSISIAIAVNIAGKDFSVGADPTTSTVTAGQSAQFNITVTPAGGFADSISFSCPAITGITCSFNPPMVSPNGGAATTVLAVTTSASVTHFGQTISGAASRSLLAGLALISFIGVLFVKTCVTCIPFRRFAASALVLGVLAIGLASCGQYSYTGQTNRGTASIVVTAQSGAVVHTTMVNVTVQ